LVPAGLAGEDVSEAARFAAAGFAAVMFDAVAGAELAAATVARWSGRALDPAIAAIFLEAPGELLRIPDPDDVSAPVVDGEPQERRLFRDEAHFDHALAGFGDAADLKTPFFHGHSRGVAMLARAASSDARTVEPAMAYRAWLVHDLVRVAIPSRPGSSCRHLTLHSASPHI
jgi:HD-GYP domain-containing protein (c-di-GMP phosphodiesterase class II)